MGTVLLGCVNFAALGCGNSTSNETETAVDGEPATDGTTSPTTDGTGGTGDTTATDGDETSAGGTGGTGTTGTTGGCIAGVPATSQVPRLLNREYDAIVHDLLGVSSLAAVDNRPPSSLLHTDTSGEMNNYTWEGYLEAANQIAAQVMAGENRSRFMSCDPTAVATCYEDTIRAFGRKMFRRPLDDKEVARFMALTTTDPSWTPEQISEAILFAFLASPSFIMVPELSVEPEGTAFRLSSHELATRLSLMLWGSVPDDELNEAADENSLTTRDEIHEQAARMVQLRDKAGRQISASHQHYVGISEGSFWWSIDHDPTRFPNYSQETRVALQGEVAAFFEELAYAGGSFKEVFLSNIAFVNQDSAAIYGLDPAEYGTDLTPVELDDTRRPGIFTRAGFLSSYSHYDATSPTLRGAFLSRFVLGVDTGPPTTDALGTPVPDGTYTTERERVEALISSRPTCEPCHSLLNPPGYVLENFDAVGSWQDVDPLGGPINATADVTFADGSVKTISSALELMQAIATDPAAHRLYAEQLVAYFTGRSPNANDACMVDSLAQKVATEGYTMLDLVVDLTQADSFRLRAPSSE